jgi:Spy/CpxP family protein refolding chaperone
MKTKLAVLTSVAALAFGLIGITPAQGQTAQTAGRIKALSKQLNLTQQQKIDLVPIVESEGPKIKKIKGDRSMSPAQKIEAIRAIHAESDPRVKEILTPEQYAKWQTIRQNEIRQAVQQKVAAAADHPDDLRLLRQPFDRRHLGRTRRGAADVLLES